MRLEVHFGDQEQWVAGHFRESPMVPGVLLLDRLEQTLESANGTQLKGWKEVRFLRPVVPPALIRWDLIVRGDLLLCEGHTDTGIAIRGSAYLVDVLPNVPLPPDFANPVDLPKDQADCIERLIPHTDEMSLLEAVADYDEERIACLSSKHLLSCHPLNSGSRTGPVTLAELGAQACALHGPWLTRHNIEDKPCPGMIVRMRQLLVHTPCRDISEIDSTLVVLASLESRTNSALLYSIMVGNYSGVALTARITIALQAGG